MDNFNVEKSGRNRNYMFSNPRSGGGYGEDVNVINRPQNIHPRDEKNRHGGHTSGGRPNLNESHFDAPRSNQRPKLTSSKGYVPMEGLDLLSNPKKFDRDEYSSGGRDDRYDQPDNNKDDYHNVDDYADNSGFIDTNEFRHDAGSRSDSDDSEGHSDSDSSSRSHSHGRSSSSGSEARKKTYEELQQEKQKFLFILNRLEKAGYIPTRKYTMASNYDDIKFEVTRLKRERDIDKSVKFQRKLLMAFTSGVEFLNSKFDPINAKLDDWSEHVMENIGDYDEVFEELHDKYADKIEVAPELKLIMMVSGSAFMYHLTQTLFKSATPGLQDILRNNPDIMRNISQAALNSMGGNDPEMQGAFNFMGDGINMSARTRAAQATGRRGGGGGGGGGGAGMQGPSGVEDILNELEAEASGEGGARINERQRRGRGARGDAINIDI